MIYLIKYWKVGLLICAGTLLISGWLVAHQRSHQLEEQQAELNGLQNIQKQFQTLSQAREEERRRYEFKDQQKQKIIRSEGSVMVLPDDLRAAYNSLRARQAGEHDSR